MHIYFSGIGGVGLGPLAMIALDAGLTVTGSDKAESDLTKQLEARGVAITYHQDGKYLADIHKGTPIDWFVYSSALPDNHPELLFAKQNNIRVSKRAEFLNLILKEKELKLIAVSGTHGKTTTTGMLIWLFKQLNISVSYSIGTTISFGPPAQYQDGSEYFIYECDEFDRNFLEFTPELSVIISKDYDHADTYPTKESYTDAFSQFANQSKLTLTWESIAEELQSSSPLFVVSDETDTSKIKLAGEHTRRNAWLAITAINRLELVENTTGDWDKLLLKISSFPGTNRRFEKLGRNLYTDYAHHPVEIAATIEMARELNDDIAIIYQPHQNIRQHELLEEKAYAHCFEGVKKVYWLPTYLSREYQDLPILKPAELIGTVGDTTPVEPAELNDALWSRVESHQNSGDLVLGMSAGDLDAWLREKQRNN